MNVPIITTSRLKSDNTDAEINIVMGINQVFKVGLSNKILRKSIIFVSQSEKRLQVFVICHLFAFYSGYFIPKPLFSVVVIIDNNKS
ncbi:hypothetical protein RT41_GL001846 [Lactococcus fujiensis JCM 16395]|uniref:Uncharacterized protein n=1 Tax=Lactococcus fujiensis JCM 16395 TaxID=1291764 RepID=A0A2A5RK02_9LACT|nr:hypothetical protein RT41_GL001846 [Lactococcus fujiensis JCM 16395]